MGCMAAAVAAATPPGPAAPTISPASLAAAFAQVPDPRRQASVRYRLPALLALATAALLANQRSVLAIAEWGTRQSADLLRRLGFPDGRAPCQSTLHRLFAKLDGRALSAALTAHFAPATPPRPPRRRAWASTARRTAAACRTSLPAPRSTP